MNNSNGGWFRSGSNLARADGGEPDFATRTDDWSVQLSSSQDKFFWIRVLRDISGGVVVTDLKRGEQSVEQTAAALYSAIQSATGLSAIDQITFSDIAPGNASDPDKVDQEAAKLAVTCVHLGKLFGRTIDCVERELRRSKVDFLVRFKQDQ